MYKRIAFAVSAALATSAYAKDFGLQVDQLAKAQSVQQFGVVGTLGASSSASIDGSAYDLPSGADASGLITLAQGLKARVVASSADLGYAIDMMALWPNDATPTHLIACNEDDQNHVGSVQRIEIATGKVETIIRTGSLTSCDPVRRTAWGTIIVGEEAGTNGRVFEIRDPLNTTDVVVAGSLGSTTIDNDPNHNVAYRPAVGALSFEGIGLYPNGVMYYGDENRPGSGNPGGAYFKFIPTVPYTGLPVTDGVAAITDLDHSPLAAGTVFGLRVGRRSGNTDYGQGNEFGRGSWIAVTGDAPINLRTAGRNLKLTSYYRPEDIDVDGSALAAGKVRFCGNNTGEDTQGGDNHWGETACITDGTLTEATANTAVPEYQVLQVGSVDFAMPDNIAYQPGTGNWVINEDGEGPVANPPRNNDIWDCLDDGADRDTLADACVKIISLNDLAAESTGGIFDASGKRYFFSIQHNSSGHGTIVEVTGWK